MKASKVIISFFMKLKWKILTNKRKCCLIKKAVNRKTRKKSKPVYSKEIEIKKDI